MDNVGDPCERSEWATENEKFTVSEEILNFWLWDLGSGTSENTEKLFFFPSRMQSFDALSMVLANLPRFSILPARYIWHLLISGRLKMLTPWSVLQEAKVPGRVYVRMIADCKDNVL